MSTAREGHPEQRVAQVCFVDGMNVRDSRISQLSASVERCTQLD